MTPGERAHVVATLPSDFPPNEANPPEGDRHYKAYSAARETLTRWFRERGKSVYVSGNLPVYYPGEHTLSSIAPGPRCMPIASRLRAHPVRRASTSGLVPQAGRYSSSVLGLDLMLESTKLRFSLGEAQLLGPSELLGKLEGLSNGADPRATELEAALEEE